MKSIYEGLGDLAQSGLTDKDLERYFITMSTVRVRAITQAANHAKAAEAQQKILFRGMAEGHLVTHEDVATANGAIANACAIGLLWAAIAEAAR